MRVPAFKERGGVGFRPWSLGFGAISVSPEWRWCCATSGGFPALHGEQAQEQTQGAEARSPEVMVKIQNRIGHEPKTIMAGA